MKKKVLRCIMKFFTIPVLIVMVNSGYSFHFLYQDNHRPVVKITAPPDNSAFTLKTRIPYSIRVSDPEDGDSKYEEINPKEVYLEVCFTSGKSGKSYPGMMDDEPGLDAIMSSNCANCHNFRTRLIGPSYYDISKRYDPTSENINLLSRRIIEGASGVWGNVKMPSHPDLTPEKVREIIKWILKNGGDPDLNYYVGTEGSILLSALAGSANGSFILTACYIDHGTPDEPGHRLKGTDRIVIHGK